MKNSFYTRQRGSSALAYGLVIGLVSIVALGAVTTVGSSIDSLFVDVSDSVSSVVVDPLVAPAGNPNANCAASTWSQTTAGTYSFTVPTGCFEIEVTVIGGGGAGGGWSSGLGNDGAASSFGGTTVQAGGGGGGDTDNGGTGLGGTGGTGTYIGGHGGEGASNFDYPATTNADVIGGDGATGGGGGATTSSYATTIDDWPGGTANQPYGGNGATGYDYWNSGTGATATGCGGGGGADHRSGGGGGGGYSVATLSVIPGTDYTVIVGAGGAGYDFSPTYHGGAGADGCVYVDYP